MQFEELVAVSEQLVAHRSRSKKSELLCACLQTLSMSELPVAVKYLCGELPQGKIGIGYAAIRKVLSSLPSESELQSTEDMSLLNVDGVFAELSGVKGAGATKRRAELLARLFANQSDRGRGFLVKLILGEMRHGAVEGVMSDAIAKATKIDQRVVRKATMLSGDLARVAVSARNEGEAGVRAFGLQLFRPVQPMLAEPIDGVQEAVSQLGKAVLEYKLDGVRVQVHKDGDRVRVFSRHLREVTASVPDVVQLVREAPAKRMILDGEVLALRSDGRPHPFQTTMRRFGRSRQVDQMQSELPLTAKFFDCLLLEDQELIDLTTIERHAALEEAVTRASVISRLVTESTDEASAFLQQAMAAGHEGLMAKSTEADYSAGGRGKNWLKIKPTHTLDLVVLAAEWGSGRRKGWLSNLHLGARVGDGGFAMIGKTFKGLTDAMLRWQTKELLRLETRREEHVVYVQPSLVAEIAFNEVQQSPHYDSGFALRFARVKGYRQDKTAEQADTLDAVESLFRQHRA